MRVAITYPMKRKRIKVAKWGTQKKIFKKGILLSLIISLLIYFFRSTLVRNEERH